MAASSEHLKHDDPCGPNVDAASVLIADVHDLWCHVDDGTALLVKTTLCEFILGREAEVNYLACAKISVIIDKNVI